MRPQPPIQCSVVLKEDPREKLLFESFPLDGISDGYSASFRPKGGRVPVVTYRYWSGGGYSPFTLSLTFYAGLNPTVNTRFSGVKWTAGNLNRAEEISLDADLQAMEAKVRWLQALCFPRPKRRRSGANRKFVAAGQPPRVLVTFGRFWTIEGVAGSCEITWKPPFHPVTARPYRAEVSVSIQRLHTLYIDWYDVAKIPSVTTTAKQGVVVVGDITDPELENPRFTPIPTSGKNDDLGNPQFTPIPGGS